LGIGTRIADALVSGFDGAPSTYFLGRHYTARNLAAYLGGSSVLRAESFRAKGGEGAVWGDLGWTRDRNRVLLVLISEIRDKIRDHSGSFTAVLRGVKDPQVKMLYEAAFRAGLGGGLLSANDWPSRSAPVEWPVVSSSLLAMRLFTEEQVSYLVPTRNLPAIRASIQAWLRQGYVRKHPGAFPMDIFRLTPEGAETVVKAGLVSEEEADMRLVIRRSQELHDLAVGDALVLAAMEIEEKGGRVAEVINEMRLIAEGNAAGVAGEAYPDFVMKFSLGEVGSTVGVEVVGVGNNYRTTAKRSKVKATGFRLLDPGFNGGGFRYV
jgi:hypothetical protein